MTAPTSSHNRSPSQSPSSSRSHLHSGKNVFSLVARREISPKTKYVPKKRWVEASKSGFGSTSSSTREPVRDTKCEAVRDAKGSLISWVEAESLRHLSGKYCPLLPPPRSTIAAAFSPDGRTIASTHGDHTVKIIDCQTGKCLKVLSGHRRTPWVVRFHPLHPEIVASGSLDHEVRIWNTITSECIGSRDFYRPIASIAFHAEGELLAVASGHKLYIWKYDKKGEGNSPTIVLKTRRSLRAVHFHPHAAPFLLTAEVNDLDSSDPTMSRATTPGYLMYPPPTVFVTNAQSSDGGSLDAELAFGSVPFSVIPSFSVYGSRIDEPVARPLVSNGTRAGFQADPNVVERLSNAISAMERHPAGSGGNATDTTADAMDVDETEAIGQAETGSSTNVTSSSGDFGAMPQDLPNRSDFIEVGQLQQFLPFRDSNWEIPFLQGWLMGHSHAGAPSIIPLRGGSGNRHPTQDMGSTSTSHTSSSNLETPVASLAIPGVVRLTSNSGRVDLHPRTSVSGMGEGTAPIIAQQDGNDYQPVMNLIQTELGRSLAAAAAAAQLPCTVKLRVWSHNIKNPCAVLNGEKCRLIIPHAVLCSEMGAHFSPCGRFLAACIACTLPHVEGDPGLQTVVHQETGAATSPTRHPVSALQVMYELRIYSLEEATFGSVLVSRAIRAAHCLTSIQFSPTSEHILLAYGRRDSSLLKSIVIDEETPSPIYTVLEVYRVSDMELVRVLPSVEDEVNVACFHPSPGSGLLYGTKEGRLRVLSYDSATGRRGPTYFPDESIVEVQTYTFEC